MGPPDQKHANKKINDPRFAKAQKDPRFQKPAKAMQRTKVDKRFEAVIKDPKFRGMSGVDKYGRGKTKSEQRDIEKMYELEEGEDEESAEDEESSDEEELSRGEALLARARGQVDVSSSDEDDSESEEEEEEEEEQIPDGEATAVLGAFNMDWDEVQAEDVFVMLSSFLPAGGSLNKVSVRATKEGARMLAIEEEKGPQISGEREQEDELLADSDSDEEGGELDKRAAARAKDDKESKIANELLRKYAKQRMGYHVALVDCDSVDTALALYRQCDGLEFEHSANSLDLRFVQPTFYDKLAPEAATEATSMKTDYKAPSFATSALNQTKVEIAWEREDPRRNRMLRQDFSKDDLDEDALAQYLACSSEEEDEEGSDSDDEGAGAAKFRSLLEDDASDEENEDEQISITWNVGLEQAGKDMLKNRAEKKADDTKTVFDKYEERRKEKRKVKKKEEKAKRKKGEPDDDDDDEQEEEDGSFNDPFFSGAEMSAFDNFDENGEEDGEDGHAVSQKKLVKSKKKKEKLTAEKKAAEAKKAAEMELLLMDEDDAGEGSRGFDMGEILEGGGKKKKGKKKKRHQKEQEEEKNATGAGFEIDLADSRFSKLASDNQFHLDPTSGQLKKTPGMMQLQNEIITKRGKRVRDAESNGESSKPKDKPTGDVKEDSLTRLVASVKAKSKEQQRKKKSKKQWD